MIYATLNLRDDGRVNGYITENPGKDNQHTIFSTYYGTVRYDHPIRACIDGLQDACHQRSIQPDMWEVYNPAGHRIYFKESIEEFGSKA